MEIWQYDRDSLVIWSLGDQGYQPRGVSVVLPMFDVVVLRSFLELSQTVGETSLMRHVRQWVSYINIHEVRYTSLTHPTRSSSS